MARKRKPPAWLKECWEFHSDYVSELDVAVDWGSFDSEWQRCWSCGHDTNKLQRCHIIPKSLGGEDKPHNLVPLCSLCHDMAPDVNDKEEIFCWIKKQQNPASGLGLGRFWHTKDLVVENADLAPNFDFEVFSSCLEEFYANISSHYTQSNSGPKIKESTREWVLSKAFEEYRQIINHG